MPTEITRISKSMKAFDFPLTDYNHQRVAIFGKQSSQDQIRIYIHTRDIVLPSFAHVAMTMQMC